MLRADHFLHLRLELAEENLLEMFEPYLHDDRLKLVSLMDHTPGQRQWTDLSHYRTYVTGKRGWSDEKVDRCCSACWCVSRSYAADNRRGIVDRCKARSVPVPLATHDDTTLEHVEEGVTDGVSISRISDLPWPRRHRARERNLGIIMGAPNWYAADRTPAMCRRRNWPAPICSMCCRRTMCRPACCMRRFLLQKEGFSLSKSINTVSRNPARMIGLVDRGEIAAQLRADFLRVRVVKGIPIVMGVWKAGNQIS